jgi:uncharacterized protein
MLRVNLGQLDREGSVAVEASLPAVDGLWDDTDLHWHADVVVRLTATLAGTGEIVARGSLQGRLSQECRRCLKPLDIPYEQDVVLVFVSDGSEVGAEDGAFPFEADQAELDLGEAIREEVLLAVNPFVVCDPECKGLCSSCGANLNLSPCSCSKSENDPRWDVLRGLKSE